MKNFIFLSSILLITLSSLTAFSQANAQQTTQQEVTVFSEAELAQMLAPIALYPDSLLTHILIASTYPIEIVEAHRWLKKNQQLSSKQIAQTIEDFDWDASVKALVPFEQVLGRLNDDLNWTQQLGDAFLQDETKLLESIQLLREQAKLAGNLEKMDNMAVSYENSNIIIEPVKKEIVYVPYYDTRIVYGNWHWSSYPPVYWNTFSSGYVSRYRPFYWHSAVHISFNYFFSAFHWHKRYVIVGNPYRSHNYRPRRLITRGGYAKRWVHQPVHRRGVAYRTKQISKKYYSHGARSHKAKRKLANIKRHNHHQSNIKRSNTYRNSVEQGKATRAGALKKEPNVNRNRVNKALHKKKHQQFKQRLSTKSQPKMNRVVHATKKHQVSAKTAPKHYSTRMNASKAKPKQAYQARERVAPKNNKHYVNKAKSRQKSPGTKSYSNNSVSNKTAQTSRVVKKQRLKTARANRARKHE